MWLDKAERETKEAKDEYDTVLKEMRDNDFIELYGMDKVKLFKLSSAVVLTAILISFVVLHTQLSYQMPSIAS